MNTQVIVPSPGEGHLKQWLQRSGCSSSCPFASGCWLSSPGSLGHPQGAGFPLLGQEVLQNGRTLYPGEERECPTAQELYS